MINFSNKKASRSRGFSLVEMLVYIAVLVMVSVAAVSSLLFVAELIAAQRANSMLTQTVNTALERVLREAKNANSVYVSESTLDTKNGTLALDTDNGTTTFAYNSGNIDVAVGTGPAIPLVSDDVSVDNITFYHYDNGTSELVRVKLVITATSGKTSKTETFYGGSVLRGSYE